MTATASTSAKATSAPLGLARFSCAMPSRAAALRMTPVSGNTRTASFSRRAYVICIVIAAAAYARS